MTNFTNIFSFNIWGVSKWESHLFCYYNLTTIIKQLLVGIKFIQESKQNFFWEAALEYIIIAIELTYSSNRTNLLVIVY